MWAMLRLVLLVFILASNCGGFPFQNPDGALQSDDLPKDEYSDVIRLLNSSALADSEESAKLAHAAKVGPHGEHRHPLAPPDAVGAPKSAKKSTKSSPVKKYKSRKSKAKSVSKHAVKSEPVDSHVLSDSPDSGRVREVLSRRKMSSKRTAVVEPQKQEAVVPEIVSIPVPQPYSQPSYVNPYQYQPSYYNYRYQPTYPSYYNDYSYPSANPFVAPHYPSFPDHNNWDNNIQVDNIPSEPVVTIPKIEPPEVIWDAEIEYPNMAPIVITSKNYTNNPHADVNILTGPDQPIVEPAAGPAVSAWTPPPIIRGPRHTGSYHPYNPAPPIIWSNGVPYVALNSLLQSQFVSSPITPPFNPMTSYNSIASPYNFVTPPVYYRPPSNLPYTQNTPVQTWLPSSEPYHPSPYSSYSTSPLWSTQPQQKVYQSQSQNHEVNIFPASTDEGRDSSVEEGEIRTSVFHGSKEVTGEKLEVNVFPADKNAADVDNSEEVKPTAASPGIKTSEDDDDDF